jgi:hypothetical protein
MAFIGMDVCNHVVYNNGCWTNCHGVFGCPSFNYRTFHVFWCVVLHISNSMWDMRLVREGGLLRMSIKRFIDLIDQDVNYNHNEFLDKLDLK